MPSVAHLLPAVLLVATAVVSGAPLPADWSASETSGGTLYRADGLPAGHELSLFATIVPVGNATTSAAFEKAKAAASPDGALRCDTPTTQEGTVSQSCSARDGQAALQFMQLPVRGGAAHILRITVQGGREALEKRKAGLAVAMQTETDRWKTGARGKPAPAEPSQKELADKARREARAAIAQAVRTAPGKGLSPSDVEGVLVSWEQVYRISGLQYEESLYLLLKDGTAYDNPWLPPEDFDVAASRKLQPGRWMQWRRQGSSYQLRSNDQARWSTVPNGNLGEPARRGERLSRTYTHSRFANHGGLGGFAQQDSFAFRSDGRYEEVGYRIQGTGTVQAGNGFTGGGAGGRSGQGSWGSGGGTQTGSGGTVGAGSTQSRNDGAGNRGAYRIDGWTIEFQIDNGTMSRQLFFFTQSDRSGINVGGTWYMAAK